MSISTFCDYVYKRFVVDKSDILFLSNAFTRLRVEIVIMSITRQMGRGLRSGPLRSDKVCLALRFIETETGRSVVAADVCQDSALLVRLRQQTGGVKSPELMFIYADAVLPDRAEARAVELSGKKTLTERLTGAERNIDGARIAVDQVEPFRNSPEGYIAAINAMLQ